MSEYPPDQRFIPYRELISNFGTTVPEGNIQVNSVKTPRVSTSELYCSGDARVYGAFKNIINAQKGVSLSDGTITNPSLTFASDMSTGIYKPATSTIGFTTDGVQHMYINPSGVVIDNQITTSSGDLILNPAGGHIDLAGNALIGIGDISIRVGAPNDVIINDNTGSLTGEVHLATVRGGTGINTSASTGVAKVASGVWSVAPIIDSDFGAINNFQANQITTQTITSVSDLTIIPGSGNLILSNTVLHQKPSSNPGTDSLTCAANIITSNNTPTIFFSLSTVATTVYSINATISLIDSDANGGTYTFIFNGKNVSGTVTTNNLTQVGKILDGDLYTTNITASVVGSSIVIYVTGITSRTIKWAGRLDIISQQF